MLSRVTHIQAARRVVFAMAFVVVAALAVTVGASSVFAQGEDECCCDTDEQKAQMQSKHAESSSDAGCQSGCAEGNCQCQLERPSDGMPGLPAVVLTNATVSFGPMAAAQTNFHVRLPEPRAPGTLVAHGAVDDSPPATPIYLKNRILLI
ncbi:MAG: hypothetical protein ACOC9J_00125 [Persicimonas sp.]